MFLVAGRLTVAVAQTQTNQVPLPPAAQSPIEFFRNLLALTPAERRQAISSRTPASQKLILAKVREYESLKPNERELRLQATELRFYLLPLMSAPETNRTEQLTSVPAHLRPLVQARLQAWDQLPADARKELVENDAALSFFSEVPPEKREAPMPNLSSARRQYLENGIRQWEALPEEQRQRMMKRFGEIFELSDNEKAKALNTLSEPERQQIEKTLRNFENLPPSQRSQCIKSFEKFASLSLAERQQFLKNADRWKVMSPAERAAWRELVANLALMPPPPNLRPGPPLPPSPASLIPNRPRSGPTVAGTNG